MRTICCISDTHGHHNDLDLTKYPADVLIHAGDWTKGRDIAFVETEEFLSWLEDQPFKHKLLIAGNHELTVERHNKFFYELLESYPSITYLQDTSVTIDGINFYGSPYSNEFYNWAFMESEVGLSKVWAKIPEDTDVLITHGPAYCTHDLVNNTYGRDPHVGSQSLYNRKKMLSNLKLHVSGHIHEAAGQSGQKPINVCASVLNDKYQLVNNPIVVTV